MIELRRHSNARSNAYPSRTVAATLIRSPLAKVVLFAACSSLAVQVAVQAWNEGWNAIAAAAVVDRSGVWALNLLLLTLVVTPLRILLRQPDLGRFRRMVGLFAFFYGCLHFILFRLHHTHDLEEVSRWNLRFAFIGILLMIPLAITSTAGWIRRLGGARWRALHSLVYPIACIGLVHYFWIEKDSPEKPILYGLSVSVIAALRIWAKVYVKNR